MADAVEKTRKTYSKRIGEIIEDVVGRDELRKALEDAPPSNKPSGIQALELGIVSPEVKEALLIAQASIRTVEAIERVESFHADWKDELAEDLKKYDPRDHLPVTTDDAQFKYVGSPGDSVELTRAQAVHQLAVVYDANEKYALKDKADIGKIPDFVYYDLKYADGFRNSAAGSMNIASQILADNGLAEAAQNLNAVAESVAPKNTGAPEQKSGMTGKFNNKATGESPGPAEFAKSHIWMQHRLVQDINMILDPMGTRNPPYYSLNEDYMDMLETRAVQAAAKPAPATPKAKPGIGARKRAP